VPSKARESWHHPSMYAVAFALWAGLLTLILWSVALLVHDPLPHSLTTAEGNVCRPGGETTIPQTKSSVTLSFLGCRAKTISKTSGPLCGLHSVTHKWNSRYAVVQNDVLNVAFLSKSWDAIEVAMDTLLCESIHGCVGSWKNASLDHLNAWPGCFVRLGPRHGKPR
jgi:hypothetical protein